MKGSVAGCVLRVACYGLRVAGYGLRVAGYDALVSGLGRKRYMVEDRGIRFKNSKYRIMNVECRSEVFYQSLCDPPCFNFPTSAFPLPPSILCLLSFELR